MATQTRAFRTDAKAVAHLSFQTCTTSLQGSCALVDCETDFAQTSRCDGTCRATLAMWALQAIDQGCHFVLPRLWRALDGYAGRDLQARPNWKTQKPAECWLGVEPMVGCWQRVQQQRAISPAKECISKNKEEGERQRQTRRSARSPRSWCTLISFLAGISIHSDRFLHCGDLYLSMGYGEVGRTTISQPGIDTSCAESISRPSWNAFRIEGHPGQNGEFGDEEDHFRSPQIHGSAGQSDSTASGIAGVEDAAPTKMDAALDCLTGGLEIANGKLRQTAASVQYSDTTSYYRAPCSTEIDSTIECQGCAGQAPRDPTGRICYDGGNGGGGGWSSGLGGTGAQSTNATADCRHGQIGTTCNRGSRFRGAEWRHSACEKTTLRGTHPERGDERYLVIQGDIVSCLRKGQCAPLLFYKSVCFVDVEAYGNDCCAASVPKSTDLDPMAHVHSVVYEDDCLYDFEAIGKAHLLRGDLLIDETDDYISRKGSVVADCKMHGTGGFEWQDQFLHAGEDQHFKNHMEATSGFGTASNSGYSERAGQERSNEQIHQPGGNERPLAFSFVGAEDIDSLLHRILEGDATLTIHSFGYKDRDLGKRTLLVDAKELHEWRRLLREQWSDHYTMPPFLIFPIRPPPFVAANTVSVIVQLGDHADGEALTLTQIVTEVRPSPDPTVVRLPHLSSKQKVCEVVGVPLRMQSSSVVKQGFVVWLTGFPRPVRDGDFLRILVDEESETMSLTQIGTPVPATINLCRPPTRTTRLLDEVRTRAQERTRESQGIGQAPVQRHPPHQGGTNRLFPWHLWEQLFNERIETEDVQANLALYGLAIEPLGTRYGWIRELSRPSILRMARLLFPEMTEWDMTLHLVTPQPQDPFEQVHILVEFLQENIQLGNMVPVLVDVRWFEASQLRREHRAAAYIATPTNKIALLEDLAHSCMPEGDMICSVWTRGSPCLDFMTATLHRGDLVSIRILPQWTDEISYGVSFSNGPAFYRFASIVTHQGPTRMINVVVHTPAGEVSTHQLRAFDTNTMRIIGTFADAVWGQQNVITFFEAPSGMRDGWHFGVTTLQSDAMPILLELVHQTDQGPLRQFSLALLLSGMSISQCIACHTEHHWHGADFQRAILFNHRPMEEDQLYTTEAPPPGTLVTISIGDPGEIILTNGEPLPEVSSESDESDITSAMQVGLWPKSSHPHVSDRCCGGNGLGAEAVLANPSASYVCMKDQEGNSVKGTPGPFIMRWRPNQHITIPFDENIPDIQHTPAGPVMRGRIIPPPSWQQNALFRSAVAAGTVFRGDDGHLNLRIRSWLIKHGSPVEPSSRDFVIRPQLMIQLPQALRRVWRDRFVGTDSLILRVVRPCPPPDADGSHYFHIIAEVNRPDTRDQPTLLAMRQINSNGVTEPTWCPGMLPQRFTVMDVHRLCNLQCQVHQLLIPLGGNIRRWMTPYNERAASAGLFLPGWWDLRRQPVPAPPYEEDEEAIDLMQRSASRSPRRPTATPTSSGSAVTAVLAHVFHLSADYRLIALDLTAPLSYFQQLQEAWRTPRHVHLLALHEVGHPPVDLVNTADVTYIVEMSTDHNRRATPTDQLVLLDILFRDAGQTGDAAHIRRTVWFRRLMTRTEVLQIASAALTCDSPEVQCELQINHQVWSNVDNAPRQILQGDFIQLSVSGQQAMPSTDIQLALCDQESADAQKYIFRDSPPHSPDSTSQPDDPSDRSGNAGQPSPPRDVNPDEKTGAVDPIGRPQALSQSFPRIVLGDITNTADARDLPTVEHALEPCEFGKPHVLDRWCAEISHSVPGGSHGVSLSSCSLNDEANRSSKSVERRTIKLEECLPEEQTRRVACPMPGLQDLCENIMKPKILLETEIPLFGLLDLRLQESIANLLSVEPRQEHPAALCLYTDGSKLWNTERAEEVAAWAAIVVAVWPDGHEELWGSYSAALQTDPQHPAWVGSTHQDSYQAEVEGIIRAMLWLCQEPLIHAGLPCTIIADATSALYATDGSFCIHHQSLKAVLRPLQKFLSQLSNVTLQWQKSHVGQVYNELADHLAKHRARETELNFACSPFTQEEFPLLQWLWSSAPSSDQGYPSCERDVLYLPIPKPLAGQDLPEPGHTAPLPEKQVELNFYYASHNVNSFKDAKEKHALSWKGRADFLRQQVITQGFNIIGWQETRRSFSGQWSSSNFIGFEGCAKQGHGGVAIWFRKDIPYGSLQFADGTTRSLRFQVSGFTVAYSSPEAMIVEYQDEDWNGVFVSAHAPTETSPSEKKIAFWDSLSMRLQPFQHRDLFVMIDANSRLGSTHDYHVGPFPADDTNENGTLLHALLQRQGLWAPATFEQCVYDTTDSPGTWLSKGGWKRIDFVLTNLPNDETKVQTWSTHLEKDVSQDDHRVVCASVKAFRSSPGHRRTFFHTTLKINREAMMTPEGKEQCVQILKDLTCSQPNWNASADRHARHINLGAQAALEKHFPFQKSKPKPSWISPEAWQTLRETRSARRKLTQLRCTWRDGMLRLILQAWKRSTPESVAYHPWIRLHDIATADALHQLQTTKSRRQALIRRDEASHLEQMARINHDELHEAKGTRLWRQLKYSLPKFRQRRKRPLPMTSVHRRLTQHFAEIEDAQHVQQEDLVTSAILRSNLALEKAASPTASITHVPTIFELEEAIRSLTNNRAFIGCVPAELLKASPAHAAELLYPTLVMFFRFYQQPTSWKGGQYFPLYKGKGSYLDPSSFRAILIGNVIPKVFHKIVRARLVNDVGSKLLPFQIGGLPKMSVHFAAHFLHCLRHQANLQKKSCAVLFFDLKSAFYRAQRSTVVHDQLGYGDDVHDEDVAVSTLNEASALEGLGVHPTLQCVIQELFSQTWCTVQTSGNADTDLLRSTRGTRPGDPVADLAFTCVMRQVLERFMRVATPILPCIHTSEGDVPVPAITWVDDVAIYLEADCANNLIPLATEVVQHMHQQCRAVGLDLNYARGKTEVLFRFHGRHSDGIRKKLHQEGKIALGQNEWSEVSLPVATKYTHLGIKHAANLSFDVELTYRLARAREALSDSRKPILLNAALSPTTRWELSRSLILSRLFFGAEIWPALSDAQQHKIQQFLYKVARIILRCENFEEGAHTTDDFVRSIIPVPSVTTLLRAARLRYAARVFHCAPKLLVEILQQMDGIEDRSWLRRVQDDMTWLQQRTPSLQHLLPPELAFKVWQDKLSNIREWNAYVHRALQADTTYRFQTSRYQMWRLQFRTGLCDLGCAIVDEPKEQEDRTRAGWDCTQCDKRFFSSKALSVHMYKQHHRHADVRDYMDSSTCGACLKDFHTVQRLRQHLQYPRGTCLQQLRAVWWPFDTQNLVDFKPQIDVKASHRIPALQCYGPPLPPRSEWQEERPHKIFPPAPHAPDLPEVEQDGQDIPEQNLTEGPPSVDLQDIIDEIVSAFERDPHSNPDDERLHHPSAFSTLADYSMRLQDTLVYEMDFNVYVKVYGWMEQLLAKHFLMRRSTTVPQEPGKRPVIPSRASRCPQVPNWILDQKARLVCPPWIPRQPKGLGSTLYILYVYSGHRREGDMVHWAKHFGELRGYSVEVITIDVIYDDRLCDMRNPDSRQLWLNYVKNGYFLAIIGAPPCETYSAARFLALEDGSAGPPPVRSLQEPWGLSTNSWKHQRQVLIANDLMQAWLLLVLAAYAKGTAIVMEHPAASLRNPDAPSIWKTVELQMLSKLPCTRQHRVIQGLFGAVSAKPTTFLVCHLKDFSQVLQSWHDPSVDSRKWIHLEGRNQDGSWKTSQGKAYPSRLNAAILDSIVRPRDHLQVEELEVDQAFLAHVQLVLDAQRTSGAMMGPDYAAN